jgi:hypothetical protein
MLCKVHGTLRVIFMRSVRALVTSLISLRLQCSLDIKNRLLSKRLQIPPWFVMYQVVKKCIFFLLWRCDPTQVMASSFLRFLDHTQRCTTVGRTLLDEWSARCRDLYLTTHPTLTTNIHAPSGIRTHDLSRRAAADLRLRLRGHWDRQSINV